ncbi:hypothetical protein NQ314_010061 [Rhamnusium bicolor]|uniref:Uncharacterized protein n=1 Tax=Rhamnusium bicolor TaxID=1586634 RepID=A0AAV8XUF1_9CUCU|nr:hypothetical protein NQ314_010061 [Rhamnusium bicolor]
MTTNILKLLSDRSEFIVHLEQDICKNIQILEETKKELHTLTELIENIKTLGRYPEQTALIPLAKNIYMEGRIVHTGEFYIKKTASPESYKIESKKNEIEKAEYAIYQLEERMKILNGDTGNILPEMKNDNLPNEIKSEKGVAIKIGEFYEILEIED